LNVPTTPKSQSSWIREEESDKVEKNIPEALVGNRTVVVIRTRMEATKGGGEV